jgi:hypothetical protein
MYTVAVRCPRMALAKTQSSLRDSTAAAAEFQALKRLAIFESSLRD